MTRYLGRVSTLLLAIGILLVGHGLQLTLLPLFADGLGWSAPSIGATGSAYFLGFIVGCIVLPAVVGRVGHIRTYSTLGALATAVLLCAGLFPEWPVWLGLRFATGFALSGLYMVVESWLVEAAPAERRGSILAVYSVVSLTSIAFGQWLLSQIPLAGLTPFVVGALLLSLAIIPIGLTRTPPPMPLADVVFRLATLSQASRVAVVAIAFTGIVTGSFWTIAPLVGAGFGLDIGQVGVMMSAGIVGGALAQVPFGRLSDRMDRRRVIASALLLGALVCVAGSWLGDRGFLTLCAIMFLLGAASMPVYALCIAQASDRSTLSLVEITSGILIMNSIGSIVGPLIVSTAMEVLGARSFFVVGGVSLALPAGWTLLRIIRVPGEVEHEHRFENLPRTTQVIAELPPEWDETEPSEAVNG